MANPLIIGPEVLPGLQQLGIVLNRRTFERDIAALQVACTRKHDQKGWVQQIVHVAVLVAAVWAGFATGSFLIALGALILGTLCVNLLFRAFQKQAYLDAKDALDERGFRNYIQQQGKPLSIDSILKVHEEYKKHVQALA